jgi:hypothetical protein
MQPRADPRRRLILIMEYAPAVSTLDPAHQRATKALASLASAK